MKQYCAGFAFDKFDHSKVVLIRKAKPQWQAGKYNAVGGSIEEGESPSEAMRREFKEETDCDVSVWRQFLTFKHTNRDCAVYFFSAFCNTAQCRTTTAEEIVVFDSAILPMNVIPNLHWLVPMARDHFVSGLEMNYDDSPACP